MSTRTDAENIDDLEEVEHEVAESPTVTFSIRLDRDTLERLREIAKIQGVGPSVLVRKWVMDNLTENEQPSYEMQARTLTEAMGRAEELIRDAILRSEQTRV